MQALPTLAPVPTQAEPNDGDQVVRPATATGGVPYWTRERIIRALDGWHREHLRAPSAREWWTAGPNHPTHWTVRNVFGSWNAALRAAGLRTRAQGDARIRPPRNRCEQSGRFVAADRAA